jgi:hypothetical protein
MRIILLVTVFLSGGVLMGLEMVSFRLMQPVYGNDIIVWGSIISVFLGGLAFGAILGGAGADRGPRLGKLAVLIAIGGAITLALPLYAEPVMDGLYPKIDFSAMMKTPDPSDSGDHLNVFDPSQDLRWPTLLVSLVLFGPPTLLLGMVSPYAARLYVHDMPNMGADVGRLYGISTMGSIVGTLVAAFYLIGMFGTIDLLKLSGAFLIGLGSVLIVLDLILSRAARPAAK